MIDSAKYPEDKKKYNICEYCNLEFNDNASCILSVIDIII